MGQPEIFHKPLSKTVIKRLADESFGDMIKFVVDLEEKIIAAGGGLHADEEKLLLEEGSRQEHLWGGNYYPDLPAQDRVEYKSMINIRPRDGNRKQDIESEVIREQILTLATHFFESNS